MIVDPERETPGMSANICARPISSASRQRIDSQRAVASVRALSTNQSTMPMTISAIAMSSERETSISAYFSSAKPAMAPGIVAMMR